MLLLSTETLNLAFFFYCMISLFVHLVVFAAFRISDIMRFVIMSDCPHGDSLHDMKALIEVHVFLF